MSEGHKQLFDSAKCEKCGFYLTNSNGETFCPNCRLTEKLAGQPDEATLLEKVLEKMFTGNGEDDGEDF
ncbi:MAG: hypothetical protein WCT37_01100 [Patescibacteria group bacterium]|jgi:uncharacterized Zn finger protein (UPF0148 family)